jgi:hypothetical protein
MRLEGMGGLRYSTEDADLSDVDLRASVVRVTAKGRREMVLPIGKKTARDIDRYIRVRAAHPRVDDAWLWLGAKGRLTPSGIYQMIKDRGGAVSARKGTRGQIRGQLTRVSELGGDSVAGRSVSAVFRWLVPTWADAGNSGIKELGSQRGVHVGGRGRGL